MSSYESKVEDMLSYLRKNASDAAIEKADEMHETVSDNYNAMEFFGMLGKEFYHHGEIKKKWRKG